MRIPISLLAALSLSACLGGGRDLPPTLATLSSTAPEPTSDARMAVRESTVTIALPTLPQAYDYDRIAVRVSDTSIAYVEDLVMVDKPDALFQQLLSETTHRLTGRVVVDPGQALLVPGTRVTGTLSRFDYDAQSGEVVVRYDAAIARGDGSSVESRRFEARTPANGTAGSVSQSLNVAANQVANDVATWIGN
ncbi:ABC-type transport auxiliary lipoprotein family protein [Sphingomicrobium clamense]|uniref:Membrane integrity-associated transporter subunit PqiC n=1 Tax=Sphingomicrobium clamense TaxID=2851013 RepID=A0ABS6V3Z2_9SPHN|nr:ABC-type transport auxiliary lipoprotein family protein [Sphingomicrobium sp. B8]MBW0144221.1 membrane integrity-associated transporter subunit PqiC [Sphingomicrobium sp. B8]